MLQQSTATGFRGFLRSRSLRATVASVVAGSMLTLSTPAFAGGCAADLSGDATVDAGDLAILLAAWGGKGSADLDGDGLVGGADLASLLASWGPCPSPCGGFTPMAFASEAVSLSPLGLAGFVTVDGVISVAPFGAPDGVISVTLPNGSVAMIEMHPGSTTILMPDVLVDIVPFATPGVILVNGVITPTTDVLSTLQADLSSGGGLDSWSPSSRATFAFAALATTDEWTCNVTTAQSLPFNALEGQGFWCKTAAYAAAAAVTVLATAGCAALTAGCATATTVTIGGMALPCVWVIGLCAGGVFVGAAVTYEGILAFWGDEQD